MVYSGYMFINCSYHESPTPKYFFIFHCLSKKNYFWFFQFYLKIDFLNLISMFIFFFSFNYAHVKHSGFLRGLSKVFNLVFLTSGGILLVTPQVGPLSSACKAVSIILTCSSSMMPSMTKVLIILVQFFLFLNLIIKITKIITSW